MQPDSSKKIGRDCLYGCQGKVAQNGHHQYLMLHRAQKRTEKDLLDLMVGR